VEGRKGCRIGLVEVVGAGWAVEIETGIGVGRRRPWVSTAAHAGWGVVVV